MSKTLETSAPNRGVNRESRSENVLTNSRSNQSDRDHTQLPKIISPKKKNPMHSSDALRSPSKNRQCAICLQDIIPIKDDKTGTKKQHQEIVTLECNHSFHKECIEQWYAQSDSCPLDRQPIKTGLINNSNIKFIGSHAVRSIDINDVINQELEEVLNILK